MSAHMRAFAAWHPQKGFGELHLMVLRAAVKDADNDARLLNLGTKDEAWRAVDVEIRKLGI